MIPDYVPKGAELVIEHSKNCLYSRRKVASTLYFFHLSHKHQFKTLKLTIHSYVNHSFKTQYLWVPLAYHPEVLGCKLYLKAKVFVLLMLIYSTYWPLGLHINTSMLRLNGILYKISPSDAVNLGITTYKP